MPIQDGQNKARVFDEARGLAGCLGCGHSSVYDIDASESAGTAKDKIVCEIYGITSLQRASACGDYSVRR
jgi:hypothetical protein